MKKLKSLGHNVKESVLHKSLEEAHNVEQMRKDRRYQQKYPPELVDKYVQKMIEIFNLPPKTPMFFRLIAPCSNWENERKEWMNGELVITRKNLCFISDDYHQSASRSQVKSVKKNEIKKGENELVVKYGDHEMKLKNLTPDNEKRAIKIIGHFAKNSDKKSLRSSLLGVPSRKKKKDSDSDSDSEITDLSDISADEHDELEHDEAARTFDEIAKQDEEEEAERKRKEQEEEERKRKEQEEEDRKRKEQEEHARALVLQQEEEAERKRKEEERKRKEQEEEEERKRKEREEEERKRKEQEEAERKRKAEEEQEFLKKQQQLEEETVREVEAVPQVDLDEIPTQPGTPPCDMRIALLVLLLAILVRMFFWYLFG